MRVLVTGAAGFIGSHLVDALVERGDDVRALDDLSTGTTANLNQRAEFVEGSITDPAVVARAVLDSDVIYHQAALGSVPRSVNDPLKTNRVNVDGTLTLLVAARDAGVKRFVWASSSSVYGGTKQSPTPEDASLQPRSPYAVTKLAGEHYARVFWELNQLETVSLRYFNVYGPRQSADSQYAAVIPRFITSLLNGERPQVHGDGGQTRDFTYVADVVKANLLAAGAPAERCAGRVFNIAAGAQWSVMQVLQVMSEALAVVANPEHVASRLGDVRHSMADSSAAEGAFGFRAGIAFPDGIRRTVDWFASRRDLHGASHPIR
jgi:nucleoside-diphosphate-sugar epimerase